MDDDCLHALNIPESPPRYPEVESQQMRHSKDVDLFVGKGVPKHTLRAKHSSIKVLCRFIFETEFIADKLFRTTPHLRAYTLDDPEKERSGSFFKPESFYFQI